MPIYGYRCSQCGHELEVFQSMSDAPMRVCPECSGSLRKLLYPVGVHFKGTGFYSTDYKGGDGSASKKTDPNGASESAGGDSSSDSSGSSASSGSTSATETKAETTASKE